MELTSENDLFFHYTHSLDEQGFRLVQARVRVRARVRVIVRFRVRVRARSAEGLVQEGYPYP